MVKMFDDADFVDQEDNDPFSPGVTSDSESLFQEEEEQIQEDAPKKINLNYESGTYIDHPSLPDQFDKFPETVKIGYPQVRVFNLKDSNQLDAYNELLKRTYPETAPDIVIVDNRVSDDFTVMITFKKLTYLIPG